MRRSGGHWLRQCSSTSEPCGRMFHSSFRVPLVKVQAGACFTRPDDNWLIGTRALAEPVAPYAVNLCGSAFF
jgi:hypothetical protein